MTLSLLIAFTEYAQKNLIEKGLFIAFPSVIKLYQYYGMEVEILKTFEKFEEVLCAAHYIPSKESLENLKEQLRTFE